MDNPNLHRDLQDIRKSIDRLTAEIRRLSNVYSETNIDPIEKLARENISKNFETKIDRAIAQREAGTMTEHELIEV